MRAGTWAEKSLPLPTVAARGPRAGRCGRRGADVHVTSCHSMLGYKDLKHPFFGWGVRDMVSRQAFRLCVDGRCAVACGGLDVGEVGVAACPRAAKHQKHDKSPDRRLRTTMTPRPLVTNPRTEYRGLTIVTARASPRSRQSLGVSMPRLQP